MKVAHEFGTEEWAREIERPYEPVQWQRGVGYKGYQDRPGRCCASVYDGRAGSHQCTRKAKVGYGSLGYCAQHDPKAKIARDEATRARWADDAAKQSKRFALQSLGVAAIAALRQIADGHNDPRTLAKETLAPFDEKYGNEARTAGV